MMKPREAQQDVLERLKDIGFGGYKANKKELCVRSRLFFNEHTRF